MTDDNLKVIFKQCDGHMPHIAHFN